MSSSSSAFSDCRRRSWEQVRMFNFGQQNRRNHDPRQSAQKSGKPRLPGDQTKPAKAFGSLRTRNEARNRAEKSKEQCEITAATRWSFVEVEPERLTFACRCPGSLTVPRHGGSAAYNVRHAHWSARPRSFSPNFARKSKIAKCEPLSVVVGAWHITCLDGLFQTCGVVSVQHRCANRRKGIRAR